ncbi:TetR/AcrR family transcriptional regulator [[Clostridium] innocuum]|nr:TetR/AcrR family transcriptional regulator [[Clostridium] innocuum]
MQLQSDLSKSYIAEALLQLMRTKRFSSITNKNITDRAGVSHITIYRNFSSKEDIIRYYLNSILTKCSSLWSKEENFAYQLFSFFQNNKETIDLLYKANLQYLLLDNILELYNFDKNDPADIAYSKVTVAYFIFGWCDVWYKRGMMETPEEMIDFISRGKSKAY